MRHITARFSIWNKLGWFGIICYCLFAMFAPSALSDTNGQIGLILAFMSIALVAFPVRKPYNAVAMIAAAMWLVASQLVPVFEFTERNPLWIALGAAMLIVSAWDENPPEEDDDDEMDDDLLRAQQLAG